MDAQKKCDEAKKQWIGKVSKVYPGWQKRKNPEVLNPEAAGLITAKDREKRDYWSNTGHICVNGVTEY